MTCSDAWISPDGRYRYTLSRQWAAGPVCVFIMLNPSTADANTDDSTIRRCRAFAKQWGFGSLIVVNLFAMRATKPKDLLAGRDPIGPQNWAAIKSAIDVPDRTVVLAWGNNAQDISRRLGFGDLGRGLNAALRHRGIVPKCLGRTQTGAPRHPLYVSSKTPLEIYE